MNLNNRKTRNAFNVTEKQHVSIEINCNWFLIPLDCNTHDLKLRSLINSTKVYFERLLMLKYKA